LVVDQLLTEMRSTLRPCQADEVEGAAGQRLGCGVDVGLQVVDLLAGPGGDMQWLVPYLGANPEAEELARRTGALLIGARTLFGDDPHRGTDREGAFGSTGTGRRSCSRTPRRPSPCPGVTFLDSLVETLARPRQRPVTATSPCSAPTSLANACRLATSTPSW
jgi:hypothetical protein